MKKFRYFVAYQGLVNGVMGFGRLEVILDEPITGMDDVEFVERLIIRRGRVTSPGLLGWQLFDDAPGDAR